MLPAQSAVRGLLVFTRNGRVNTIYVPRSAAYEGFEAVLSRSWSENARNYSCAIGLKRTTSPISSSDMLSRSALNN